MPYDIVQKTGTPEEGRERRLAERRKFMWDHPEARRRREEARRREEEAAMVRLAQRSFAGVCACAVLNSIVRIVVAGVLVFLGVLLLGASVEFLSRNWNFLSRNWNIGWLGIIVGLPLVVCSSISALLGLGGMAVRDKIEQWKCARRFANTESVECRAQDAH